MLLTDLDDAPRRGVAEAHPRRRRPGALPPSGRDATRPAGPRSSPRRRSASAGSTCWSPMPASASWRRSLEMSLADWRKQTAINIDGVFLSVKHAIPVMRKAGGRLDRADLLGRRAARLGGAGGLFGDQGGGAAVCQVGRAGMRRRARRHPLQQRPSRHHRHAIWEKIPAGADGNRGATRRSTRAPSPRPACRPASWAQAQDIANGVLFLASDASRYVTGSELVIDSGLMAGRVGNLTAR